MRSGCRPRAESHAALDSHPSADRDAFAYPVESEVVENTDTSSRDDCGVDFAVNAKIRPSWELTRTQIQMQGAPFCDFRWRLRGK